MWIDWDALVLLGALRALVSVGWLRCYEPDPVGSTLPMPEYAMIHHDPRSTGEANNS